MLEGHNTAFVYGDIEPMHPNNRNILLALFSIPFLSLVLFQVVFIMKGVVALYERGISMTLTVLSSAGLLFISFVVVPVLSLLRLSRRLITSTPKSVFSLFNLHLFSHSTQKSMATIFAVSEAAERHAGGDEVRWVEQRILSAEDRALVREVVEETLAVRSKDNDFFEISAWLLVFSNLVAASVFFTACRFALEEALQEEFDSSLAVGKAVTEWLANYFLLFVGFWQAVTGDFWYFSLMGICKEPLSTYTDAQVRNLIGLYILMSDTPVDGLKRQGCYAKVQMDGIKWKAPKISSILLAALGEEYTVYQQDGKWHIDRTCSVNDANERTNGKFEVRFLGEG